MFYVVLGQTLCRLAGRPQRLAINFAMIAGCALSRLGLGNLDPLHLRRQPGVDLEGSFDVATPIR